MLNDANINNSPDYYIHINWDSLNLTNKSRTLDDINDINNLEKNEEASNNNKNGYNKKHAPI